MQMLDSSFKVYGIPYMGNKAIIARDIFNFISSKHETGILVEPFCGGFSVGSTFLRNGWQVVANDYNKYTYSLLKKTLEDGLPEIVYNWVTREHFTDVKNTPDNYEDWYVGYIGQVWSFGTRGINGSYLFAKEIEETKRLGHFVCTSKTSKERRLNLKLLLRHITKSNVLEQEKDGIILQQLEQLEQLERLERLELYNLDYRNVPIPHGAVVYCDPPYENTASYKDDIDHTDFWQWVRYVSRTNPIYVSSYTAPDDMALVWSKEKTETLSNQSTRKKKLECLFTFGDN